MVTSHFTPPELQEFRTRNSWQLLKANPSILTTWIRSILDQDPDLKLIYDNKSILPKGSYKIQ